MTLVMNMDTALLEKHIPYMKHAISLAKTGMYTTRPNPCVGCVLVKKIDGKETIIGEGYHFKAGEPHAEVHALRDAENKGFDARGCTAYVTLEPCSHRGKTPPCTDALILAEVAEVVMAITDPNPKVSGKGVHKLQNAGIRVIKGVCAKQARSLNKGYLKAMAGGMPYVRLKIACSMDGRIAMASGESKWITGDKARREVQHWRAMSGAIITGSETVVQDNPQLNVRYGFKKQHKDILVEDIPQPIRVVLDRRGRVDMNFTMMNDGQLSLVYGHDDSTLMDTSIPDMLEEIRDKHKVYDVLIEAGGTIAGAFLEADLVDEIILYQAPVFLGISAQPMLNFDIATLTEAKRFRLVSQKVLGEDICTRMIKVSDS